VAALRRDIKPDNVLLSGGTARVQGAALHTSTAFQVSNDSATLTLAAST
jgi:hypothetical protein